MRLLHLSNTGHRLGVGWGNQYKRDALALQAKSTGCWQKASPSCTAEPRGWSRYSPLFNVSSPPHPHPHPPWLRKECSGNEPQPADSTQLANSNKPTLKEAERRSIEPQSQPDSPPLAVPASSLKLLQPSALFIHSKTSPTVGKDKKCRRLRW